MKKALFCSIAFERRNTHWSQSETFHIRVFDIVALSKYTKHYTFVGILFPANIISNKKIMRKSDSS